MRYHTALSILLLAIATPVLAQPAPPTPSTILVGKSWVSLWHDGKAVAFYEDAEWRFEHLLLSPDGRTLQIVVRRNISASSQTLLTFDARTLKLQSQTTTPEDSFRDGWIYIGRPMEASFDAADYTDPTSPLIATQEREGTLVRVKTPQNAAPLPAYRLPVGKWRIILSPDGSTAAAFAQPEKADKPWPGIAWDTKTGKTISSPGLSIDSGINREDGTIRSIACLLPRGEGAFFTYSKDSDLYYSEFQLFDSRNPTPVNWDISSAVLTCMTGPTL